MENEATYDEILDWKTKLGQAFKQGDVSSSIFRYAYLVHELHHHPLSHSILPLVSLLLLVL